jgi:enoyl-CoA hydratase/carnithine racemase
MPSTYRIAQDRANKIVILTGAGGEFIPDVDRLTCGDVADPRVWSQLHDEGAQVLENIANMRAPVIAAIDGRAHVHSDYALLASVIVAADGATFQDVAHFAAGVAPGDGIFTSIPAAVVPVPRQSVFCLDVRDSTPNEYRRDSPISQPF